MEIETPSALVQAKCTPCEGGVEAFSQEEAMQQVVVLNGWELSHDIKVISKSWNCKNFEKAIRFVNKIAELAEREQHHPDIHVTGYRHVKIDLTTHAIGGLSKNDFIIAAKIDQLTEA